MHGVDQPFSVRGGIAMGEHGDIGVTALVARAQHHVTAQAFRFVGHGGSNFTGSKNSNLH